MRLPSGGVTVRVTDGGWLASPAFFREYGESEALGQTGWFSSHVGLETRWFQLFSTCYSCALHLQELFLRSYDAERWRKSSSDCILFHGAKMLLRTTLAR